jgi:hypothetical protein
MPNALKKILIIIAAATGFLLGQEEKPPTGWDECARQFGYADSLFANGNYFDAVTEFKRLLFFDAVHEFSYRAAFKIAESYKMGGKYSEAIYYYRHAEKFSSSKEQILPLRLGVIKVNILRRTCGQALNLLNELSKDTNLRVSGYEIEYWRGWAYLFNDEWEKAAECFGKSGKGSELKEIALKTENELYSPITATLLSVFLPGAGQFYTGNYLSGLMSLGWNFLWGYISVNSFVEKRVFDGIMTANFLWLRFYMGNAQNAGKFAEQKNRELINNTLLYLQNNFIGEKP